MTPIQMQDVRRLPSLVPPKLTDYQIVLLVRAALRQRDAGVSNRIEFERAVRAALERAR